MYIFVTIFTLVMIYLMKFVSLLFLSLYLFLRKKRAQWTVSSLFWKQCKIRCAVHINLCRPNRLCMITKLRTKEKCNDFHTPKFLLDIQFNFYFLLLSVQNSRLSFWYILFFHSICYFFLLIEFNNFFNSNYFFYLVIFFFSPIMITKKKSFVFFSHFKFIIIGIRIVYPF